MKRLLSITFVICILSVATYLAQATSTFSPAATKIGDKPPVTHIDFSASDAAKIATINLSADAQIRQIDQERWTKIQQIFKTYNIPQQGWELVFDDSKNIIGAQLHKDKEEAKKP